MSDDVERLARAMCEMDMGRDVDHVLCTWKHGVSVNHLHAWEAYKELAQKAIDMLAMSDEKRTPVTDSEKLADQMAADITSGKVGGEDRPVVRKALDDADGRSKSQDAGEAVWRRATGRNYSPDKPYGGWSADNGLGVQITYMPSAGGAMKPNNWRIGPDGEPREVD